jgi:tagaturonate reductase
MSAHVETVLQFGAGRFLRAFVDRFVQHANDAGKAVGRVVVVQSTPGPRAQLLNEQPAGYHVLVRGIENGEVVERIEVVRSVQRAMLADAEWQQVLEIARSAQLQFIVSNSTEAGYALDLHDQLTSAPPRSWPGKLTQLLWHRFQAGAAPVVILPCELFESNAEKLRELTSQQGRQWALPDAFLRWMTQECCWLNSLVDCIVTAGPPDHPLASADRLLVCAEPYALWAIARPASADMSLSWHPAMRMVDDLAPYYLRKVRILNGLHTAMVGKFRGAGFTTVQQLLADRHALRWARDLVYEEIVPTLAYRLDSVAEFADQVFDRFRNPFLAHQLSDIALHHKEKVRIRLEPTRSEYEKLFGKAPRLLTEAMA